MRISHEEPEVVKKGGFLGKLVALLLGAVLGLLGFFGGIVGAGYYIGTQPINQAVTSIDSIAGTNLSTILFGTEDTNGILNKDYAEKYVKDIVGDSFKAIQGLSNGGTLSDFSTIFPKVDTLVGDLLKITDKYGIPFTSDGVLKTPFKATEEGQKDFTTYLVDSLKGTVLGDLLTGIGEPPSGLFKYLCYGEKNEDYTEDDEGNIEMIGNAKKTTVKDLLSGDLMAVFQKVPLAAVALPTVDDSAMLTIAYGRKDVTYIINNPTAGKGTEADVTMQFMFYNLKDGKFVDYAGAEVDGTILESSDVSGYKKFQLPTEEGEEPTYIYLKEPTAPETRYFVYEKLADATMKEKRFPKTKLSDVTGDAMGLIDRIYLKDILNVDDDSEKTNAVLESLCYDKDGNPNTIGQLRNEGGNLVNSIPFDAIMSHDQHAPIVMYLLYGHVGTHYKMVMVDGNEEPEMLQKFIAIHNGKAYNEYGELLKEGSYVLDVTNRQFKVGNGEPYTTYTYETSTDTTEDIHLRDVDVNGDGKMDKKDVAPRSYLFLNGEEVMFEKSVLGDFANNDNKLDTLTAHLTISDIFSASDLEENSILQSLSDCYINDIGDEIHNIKLSALFTESELNSNKILKSLGDSTLNTLSDDINNLTIGNILDVNENSNSILKALKNETLNSMAGAIDKLTVEDVLHDQIYNLNAEGKYLDKDGNVTENKADAVKGTWVYLLKDKEEGQIKTNYKLLGSNEGEGMNCLIENMKHNIHDATLRDLNEKELIAFNSGLLNSEIKTKNNSILPIDYTPASGKSQLGDLTVTEMLEYVNSVLAAIDEYEEIISGGGSGSGA
ncbi:MAG: hypothetical protein E7349_01010 [Clostridiales bacterium]|nr:hypothetical protein [Clostridiales bacterium]